MHYYMNDQKKRVRILTYHKEIEIGNFYTFAQLATWQSARAFLQPGFSSCICSDLVSDFLIIIKLCKDNYSATLI